MSAIIVPFRRPRTNQSGGDLERDVCACRMPVTGCADLWPRDLSHVRRLRVSAMGRRAHRLLRTKTLHHAALAAYVCALVEACAHIVHVELLELPFWVERLTQRLHRAGAVAEIVRWMETYEALPSRARREMTSRQRARLVARRAGALTRLQ